MRQYIMNLNHIMSSGTLRKNRTGINTKSISGTHFKHYVPHGFPLITTKKMATTTIVAELICFLRGYDNAKDFRAMNCNIWNKNANETKSWLESPYRKGEDDLGRIYGVQWRYRRDVKFSASLEMNDYLNNNGYDMCGESTYGDIFIRKFDQLKFVIDQIKTNPTNRRIIMNAWNPNEEDEMVLPPCHCSYHFIPDPNSNSLDLCMHQRSADYFLGVPFNIASASLLLCIIAKVTGYSPGWFTHFMDDSHIYENHTDQVNIQLKRDPFELCNLKIDDAAWDLSSIDNLVKSISVDDFKFQNYMSYSAIKGEMAA